MFHQIVKSVLGQATNWMAEKSRFNPWQGKRFFSSSLHPDWL
jgi:hypothetical protein